MTNTATVATVAIVVLALAGVVARPFGWNEAVWAVLGGLALVVVGVMPAGTAIAAVLGGADVYLFLLGMMLLAETARCHGVFDWLAGHAVRAAHGSAERLFVIVYAVGIAVTAMLSNDATAVVLTPAVFAAARRARTDPLPSLLACAFVANAASFLLPISNPANLLLYRGAVPPLATWLARLFVPAVVAILATFVALQWTQRRATTMSFPIDVEVPHLSRSGRVALGGIACTVVVMLATSSIGRPFGLPTAMLGTLTMLVVVLARRRTPMPMLRDISWGILPLVAGLFVLVQALDRVGVVPLLSSVIARTTVASTARAVFGIGGATAIGTDLMNNLPVGLLAHATLAQAHAPARVVDAMLIGVDLGPNLSVTGSLATILWLTAIRREGMVISFRQFFRVGIVVMPPALLLAMAARLIIAG
jgi:arsenical pump membrane protein